MFPEQQRIVFEENRHIIRKNPDLSENDDHVADYAVELFNKQSKAPTRFVYSDDESDAVETASIRPAIPTNRQPILQYQGFNDYNP